MCIIVVKKKGVELPKKEILKNCYENNNDGAGYMYVNNNKVYIKKGYMSFNDFYKDVNKIKNVKDKNLVLHFRIGTSGKNVKGCTHPFPISENENYLNALEFKTDMALCHNGVITKYTDYTSNLNDTQLFIKNFIAPLKKLNNNFLKYKKVRDFIHKMADSKLVFLDKNDNLTILGDFIEADKILYSNSSYNTKKIKYNYNFNWGYDWGSVPSYGLKNKKDIKKIDKNFIIWGEKKYNNNGNYYVDADMKLYEKIEEFSENYIKVKEIDKEVYICSRDYSIEYTYINI